MNPSRCQGFTLIELIIVIVIIGALSALVASRMSTSSVEQAGFEQQIKVALRYAQRLAVVTGCEVQVQVDAAADSVALFRRAGGTATSCGGGAFIEAVTSPGTNTNYLITASANADVTSGLTIAFDSIGRPSPAGGSVVISGRTILVEAESGYVH